MENKRKHLEMIQTIISRMSSNSFYLKGLCVTIVAAICALAVVRSNAIIYLLLLPPIVSLWMIDAHYLHQEKLFRALYNKVRIQQEEEVDFSMDTIPFKRVTPNWFICFLWNWSTTGFYLPFAVISPVLFYIATQPELCDFFVILL